MIRRRRLETLFVLAALAMSLTRPGAAQDATFPCKVLLCSQANWPTIPYCVPIMKQAIWMQLLGVAVGICQQAVQQAQQNQSNPQSPPVANAPSGLTNTISCPSGVFPVSQANGGYTINSDWFDVRGAHVAGGAGRCRFSMSSTIPMEPARSFLGRAI